MNSSPHRSRAYAIANERFHVKHSVTEGRGAVEGFDVSTAQRDPDAQRACLRYHDVLAVSEGTAPAVCTPTASLTARRTDRLPRRCTRWRSRLLPRALTYGEVIEKIDEPMRAAATEAEMRSRGAGLAYVLRQLKLPSGR